MGHLTRGFHLLLLGVLALGSPAGAALIDLELTAAGGSTHFSTQLSSGFVPWDLFYRPMAVTPPAAEDFVFSEPGMGNPVAEARGQVLLYSPVAGRNSRLVVDLLAWVPSPQLFFLDPDVFRSDTPHLPAPSGFVPAYVGGPARLLPSPPPPPPPIIFIIPEPTTLTLIALAAALVIRRPRPAH